MNPLSLSKKKQLRALLTVKGRYESRKFLAEGERCVREILNATPGIVMSVISTAAWLKENAFWVEAANKNVEFLVADEKELKELSSLNTPPKVIAVCEFCTGVWKDPTSLRDKLSLALDCIQDPGNFGTIIRLADWWGIKDIICSKGTVDVYNPKVIQSTMGALSRVNVFEAPSLVEYLREAVQVGLPIYGTFLDGDNLFKSRLSLSGILVMGNEGNGITNDVASVVTNRLSIPCWPLENEHVESLNVGTATAIFLAEFRRRLF